MVLPTLTMYSKYTFNNNSFTKDNVIKLIDYITTMPYSETDNDISYKYPFNASELLKCDNTTICEIIFEESPIDAFGVEIIVNEEDDKKDGFISIDSSSLNNDKKKQYKVLEHFFSFLLEKNKNHNRNNLLCGYFRNVFKKLIEKNSVIITQVLFNENEMYIDGMIELCSDESIGECLKLVLDTDLIKDSIIKKKEKLIETLITNKIYNKDYGESVCNAILIPLLKTSNVFRDFFFNNYNTFMSQFHFEIINLGALISFISAIIIRLKSTFGSSVDDDKEDNLTLSVCEEDMKSNVQISLDIDKYIGHLKEVIKSLVGIVQNEISNSIIKEEILNCINMFIKLMIKANKEKESIIQEVITTSLLIYLTKYFINHPNNNIFHIAYIKLLSSLRDVSTQNNVVKSMIINDSMISLLINYLRDIYPEHKTLLAPTIKSLDIILSLIPRELTDVTISMTSTATHNDIKEVVDAIMIIFNRKFLYEVDNLSGMKEDEFYYKETFSEIVNGQISKVIKDEDSRSENISESIEANLEDELNYAITKTEHLNDSIDNIIRIVNTTKEDKQHKEYTDSLYWSQRLSKKEEDEMNELMKSL